MAKGPGRSKPKTKALKSQRLSAKIHKNLKEMKAGKLHSGSRRGPLVKNRKQAIAIAASKVRH